MKEFCVDLELAKELRDNGYPQKGNYGYFNIAPDGHEEHIILNNSGHKDLLVATSPIAEELVEQLPDLPDNGYYLEISHHYEYYCVCYRSPIVDHEHLYAFVEPKLSHALAKMWIYLKKEKYIK